MTTLERCASFYATPAVRARVAEFLGAGPDGTPSAVFVAEPSPSVRRPFAPRPPEEIWSLLQRRHEAARSLWDRRALLADLDLEHVHFDLPWLPLLEPDRSAALLRPIVDELLAFLGVHAIQPLHVLTGRGHHFLWRVERDSRAFRLLAAIGALSPGLAELYRRPQPPSGDVVGLELGAAQHGLGKVLEFAGQEILRRAAPRLEIPASLAAVLPLPGPRGHEMASLDLTAFGDPLHVRTVRVPFTAYRKAPRLGAAHADARRLVLSIPVVAGDERASREAMHDFGLARELAARADAAPPLASDGMEELVASYLGSSLRRFHDEFESTAEVASRAWPDAYERLDAGALPPCVRLLLEQPNDLLLRPAGLRLLVRTLHGLGWKPRHAARWIEAKLLQDRGWIAGLHFHHAGVRAEFYARLFGGLLATGLDDRRDFTCEGAGAEGLCPATGCGWRLGDAEALVGGRHG